MEQSEEILTTSNLENNQEQVTTPIQDEPEPAKMETQEKPTKQGFFSRLVQGLVKTKQNIGAGFLNFFTGKKIDDDLFEELEEQLLIADVGVPTTSKIINNLTEHATRKQLKDAELLYQQLKVELGTILKPNEQPLILTDKKPFVILMVGVNGVGKTTTITGRSHQLRVHMLALGHPILGDKFYSPPQVKAMAPRLCLHAESLTITHPITKEVMTFSCPAEF
ncbi:signal recognition particle receptor subunit alpha [Gallibacterium melopsittaci]|uniref:Signal recognition particle receptor subunit alpha n=1 Tax=Gallibacterium melopsittaci TaxID=516063 RepID=A0ABV6HU94_9PAST